MRLYVAFFNLFKLKVVKILVAIYLSIKFLLFIIYVDFDLLFKKLMQKLNKTNFLTLPISIINCDFTQIQINSWLSHKKWL